MRCFGLFLVLFTLSSCAGVSPTQEAIQDAQSSIVQLEKDLPPQCKTKEINARIDAIKTKIDKIESRSEAQLAVEKSEKVRWKTAFLALAVIMAAWVAKRLVV